MDFENVPQDEASERAVLGALLISQGDSVIEAVDILGEDGRFFYSDQNSEVYEAMMGLYEKDAKIDTVSVASALGGVEKAIEYNVHELSSAVPTSANLPHYARLVQRAWQQRQLVHEAERLRIHSQGGGDPEQGIEDMEHALLDIAKRSFGTMELIEAKEGTALAVEHFKRMAAADGQITGVPTGIEPFDKMTGGMQSGNLVVLAARPAVGKTAFALNIANHAAIKNDIPVLFLSLEMETAELWCRLMSVNGVASDRIQAGFLARPEIEKAEKLQENLGDKPLSVMDHADCTLSGVCSVVRRWISKHDKGLVILDYLQLIAPGHGQQSKPRWEVVGEQSRALKGLAKECSIPIVLLAQLGRGAEDTSDGFKMVRYLRESGNIEQDADMVCILSKPTEEDQKATKAMGVDPDSSVTLTLAKHRNGPTGAIPLHFEKKTQRFLVPGEALVEEYEGRSDEPQGFGDYEEDGMAF